MNPVKNVITVDGAITKIIDIEVQPVVSCI